MSITLFLGQLLAGNALDTNELAVLHPPGSRIGNRTIVARRIFNLFMINK
jgi:hypothetical protein